jgi:serine/threonine protein kinase
VQQYTPQSGVSRLAPFQLGQMFFRYRIERCLGRGGMGEVYEAFDTRLRRPCALKILTVGGVPSYAELRQLLLEARSLAALQHRNIVTVYDVNEHANVPYLTMELLRGRSIAQLAKSGAGTTSDRLRWLVEIAGALATVHRAGLVHRDVKPGNVMVTEDGRAVLFDFGIARQTDRSESTYDGESTRGSGMVIGTPRYMAPELVTGTRASASTDQYAWGVIAAQLLTGTVPSPDDDVARLLAEVRVPQPIAAIVLRAVDPRPELRFPTMDEIVGSLEPLTRVAGGVRRSRLVSVVIVAGLSLLVGATAGVLWQRHSMARAPAPVPVPTPVLESRPTSSSPTVSTPLIPLSATATTPAPPASSESTPTPTVSTTTTGVVHPLTQAGNVHECVADADCGCGVDKNTGVCAVGPLTRINTTRTCPDYCEGFGGGIYMTCHAGRCMRGQRWAAPSEPSSSGH